MPADGDEAREFRRAFLSFLSWIHADEGGGTGNQVVRLIRDHLGTDGLAHSVVSRAFSVFDHVNIQVALDHWMATDGRNVRVHGIALPPHYSVPTLQQLGHGDALPPLRLSAPDLVDLPSGPDRTLGCFQSALLLVDDADGRYVIRVQGPVRHEEPVLTLEVAGLATDRAQAVLRGLDELRSRLNVYRGQLLEFAHGPTGMGISFARLPRTNRDDVVLPEHVLRRVERHTVGIAAQREALRAAGQHLKRGLLLYGPPGTGKTHTTRYLVQQLSGTTVLMLSGRWLHLVGEVTQLARELQPSAVVLEDVDLVAEDREYGPGPSHVLFELLDAMDGAAQDADLLFLLTTNRADLLEPALAARPGRVDVAVEIDLPDSDARRRLLEVYGRGLPLALSEDGRTTAVERTAGVTASFIKELLRRAVLEAVEERGLPLVEVTDADLGRALDDLLDSTQSVTRALLGVRDEPAASWRPEHGRAPGHGGMGWTALPGRMPTAYPSSSRSSSRSSHRDQVDPET